MQQAGEYEFDIVTNTLAVKTGKDCGGRCAVKTFVVVINMNFQLRSLLSLHRMIFVQLKVNRNDITGAYLSSGSVAGLLRDELRSGFPEQEWCQNHANA